MDMGSILERARMLLGRLIHLPWRRWGRQHLRRVLYLGNIGILRVPTAHLEPDGGDSEEEEEAGVMMTMISPQHPPLPDVGTLARVWADEQAAQVAEQTTESLLSRPIRIEDVCAAKANGQSDHSMPSMALFTSLSLTDDVESLQLRRLWHETVVWDDGCQGW